MRSSKDIPLKFLLTTATSAATCHALNGKNVIFEYRHLAEELLINANAVVTALFSCCIF